MAEQRHGGFLRSLVFEDDEQGLSYDVTKDATAHDPAASPSSAVQPIGAAELGDKIVGRDSAYAALLRADKALEPDLPDRARRFASAVRVVVAGGHGVDDIAAAIALHRKALDHEIEQFGQWLTGTIGRQRDDAGRQLADLDARIKENAAAINRLQRERDELDKGRDGVAHGIEAANSEMDRYGRAFDAAVKQLRQQLDDDERLLGGNR